MRTSRKLAVYYAGGKTLSFTYTGTYTLLHDGGDNWRIKFLTSGTFTPDEAASVDIFAVGGGGGGTNSTGKGGGGGGGFTSSRFAFSLVANRAYAITVGAGGAVGSKGGKSAFSYNSNDILYANGGSGSTFLSQVIMKGSGGSGGGGTGDYLGGTGGSDGSDGSGDGASGYGQHTTTKEFGEANGTLYAGGGGGKTADAYDGLGGAGGGGDAGQAGTDNLGGGGGANAAGGSGIVIIRNARS